MSRSNPRTTNPAAHFIGWSGSEGALSYWDKEEKEDVPVEFPFTFLVLDELNTVRGFQDSSKSGFFANEVRDVTKDEISVRTKKGLVGKGLWAELKNITGTKYAKSIYIAMKDDTGELILANLTLSGAALTAWIEFNKTYNVYKGAVTIVGAGPEQKKGATKYFAPEFKGINVSDETDAAATALDAQLQEYLNDYFNRKESIDEAVVVEDFDEEDADEEAPAPKSRSTTAKTAPVEEEEKPIDLTEVPF